MSKTAFITGVSGQDGSYLTELLIVKGYEVHGIDKRPPHDTRVHYTECDLHDYERLAAIIKKLQPDEVYNLAAQSSVSLSFDIPVETGDITALGAARILEAIRRHSPKTRFYQAGSSEMFGTAPAPQSESTPFNPRSPYSIAKVYAFSMTKNYREGFKLFTCNGIMFNHESPRRPEEYLTRKIALAVAKIKRGEQEVLELGNLDAKRDWGYAPEYVEAMWRVLQHDSPDDYVIATGETHTVREFCEHAFNHVGMQLTWSGVGIAEQGRDKNGVVRVRVNPQFFRPLELFETRGDASKARHVLGWKPAVTFAELVRILVDAELRK